MNIKPLKYLEILPTKKQEIKNIYKDYQVSEHIDNLYAIIEYQMQVIAEQRAVIIAENHREAWRQYDRSLEEYNAQTRRVLSAAELKARKC